jgi:hypothetical protein
MSPLKFIQVLNYISNVECGEFLTWLAVLKTVLISYFVFDYKYTIVNLQKIHKTKTQNLVRELLEK